ncbi:hypothetical protein HYH03_011142 [Edaphochlamys debaryana]|uniref:Uncharacterized protein n=1 Tax=Edaphochlamys debaryana TaxID=47281 RepID=A0A835XY26_9CHLO|nr:hypothetical protein HYH03_011142 [Edaphochlamys debaryana]|eukprot:KAG2490521.1 hypothetical protein HYH03_011142 [Edaphochlamys debaryana]
MDERVEVAKKWLNDGVCKLGPGVMVDPVHEVPLPPDPDPENPTTRPLYESDAWLKAWALDIIWIDGKTTHVKPKGYTGWTAGGFNPSSIVKRDWGAAARKKNGDKIVYYSAVSARFGGILLKPVSGTRGDGYTPEQVFQVKEGDKERPAKGPTGEEIATFLGEVYDKNEQLCKEASRKGNKVTCRPIWSLDNASVNKNAVGEWHCGRAPITANNVTNLPPYSGDMHNVIETSHALICYKLQQSVNERGRELAEEAENTGMASPDPLTVYIDKLQEIFTDTLTPEWGMKTVKRLFATTLPAILAADGNYPEKAYR